MATINSKPPSSASAGRFTQAGYTQFQAKVTKLENDLTAVRKDLKAQRHTMTVAFYSPEGLKKAQAKLTSLEKQEAKLAAELKQLKDFGMRA